MCQVAKLREELALRGLNTKGLKAQLTTRLLQALSEEKEKETDVAAEIAEADEIIETDMEIIKDHEAKDGSGQEVAEVVENDLSAPTMVTIRSSDEIFEDAEVDYENEETDIVIEELDCTEPESIPSPSGILVPILTPDMDEKTKKIWERRYALPKKPHVLAHPPHSTKNVDIDCAKMCLSSLREYRLNDAKEQSTEVSLFAEFFYEMLQRDFAFRIYCEAVQRSQVSSSSTSSKPQVQLTYI